MLITGCCCSFLAQPCTVLPQSCGFSWGVLTHARRVAGASCDMTIRKPRRPHVTDEERKRDVEGHGGDSPWVSPVWTFTCQTICAVCLRHQCSTSEGEADVRSAEAGTFCLSHWPDDTQLSWASPAFHWLLIRVISEKGTDSLLPYL